MNKLNQIILAIKVVLRDKKYLAAFLFLSVAIFWLFIYIPVKNIPGNDFAFQLSIMTLQDKILLVILSLLVSLSIVMNVYAFKLKRSAKVGISMVGQGGGGLFSGAAASIFGTATCASCVASIFGFLGTGGVLFLLEYRTQIVLVSAVLLLISIYFTSAKVLGVCKSCGVKL